MSLILEAIQTTRLAWLMFERYDDGRGWLAELFNQEQATALGLPRFGQDNASFSPKAGILRGLHYQRPPFAQAKLLRVVRGAIFHVAVDLMAAEPQAHTVMISAGESRWLYLPSGFAHGFQTLTDDTELTWKLSAPFRPDHAGALLFDDPDLGVRWPLAVDRAMLSQRDREGALLGAAAAQYAATT
jgi:dTDP-4-dehydrorhamnose 3,5-epimerase